MLWDAIVPASTVRQSDKSGTVPFLPFGSNYYPLNFSLDFVRPLFLNSTQSFHKYWPHKRKKIGMLEKPKLDILLLMKEKIPNLPTKKVNACKFDLGKTQFKKWVSRSVSFVVLELHKFGKIRRVWKIISDKFHWFFNLCDFKPIYRNACLCIWPISKCSFNDSTIYSDSWMKIILHFIQIFDWLLHLIYQLFQPWEGTNYRSYETSNFPRFSQFPQPNPPDP